MRDLTARQRECLEVIEAHIALHGFPPTIREIGSEMGGIHTNAVTHHLDALERKKWIALAHTAARGIRVLRSANDVARAGAPPVVICATCRSSACWKRNGGCFIERAGATLGSYGTVVPAAGEEREAARAAAGGAA